ncbi:MAG: hypothetical protein WDZ51_16440 [Pirellulaceae bacterium]
MTHRRITRSPGRWTVCETGSGRILAQVPIDPVWEPTHPAEQIAREIKALPAWREYLTAMAAQGDVQAAELLKVASR